MQRFLVWFLTILLLCGGPGTYGPGGQTVLAAGLCGVTPTTSAYTNITPVAIPSGPAVVTSTIVVFGENPYLLKVDLQTFITHTYNEDLDITLKSPAGTVVTLTTDNGASHHNVFNGTKWNDSAKPGGQVPYTSNNGLATDHAYVYLVTATPLAPEEPLAAFIGENPNGTWTLTISDDEGGDGGNLSSWSLNLTTVPSAPPSTFSTFTNTTPLAVPTGPAVVTSTLLVSGAGTYLLDVDLQTFLTHTFARDLDITLKSPAGTVVTLTTDNGFANDDVFNGTTWNDSANPGGQVPYTTNNGVATDHAYVNLVTATPLAPEEPLGAFIGEDPSGTWTLTISDDEAGDGGTLSSWSLNLSTFQDTTPPTAACIPGPAPNGYVNPVPNGYLYTVQGSDACSTVGLTIKIGPYLLTNGEVIRIVLGTLPGVSELTSSRSDVRTFRVGPGQAEIKVTDGVGNFTTAVCPSPPAPSPR